MDVAAWCRESRVWIVAGKGGVGKTTVTAALAYRAAEAGLSVLVVELEGRPGLPAAFGGAGHLGYGAAQLWPPPSSRPDGQVPVPPAATPSQFEPGSVWGRRLTPDDALLEYLADHGLHRVSKRLVSSGVLDVVATAIPGMRDVLVLGKVKQLERAGTADVVIVDAPATGHAMTFLTSATGLLDAARSGPIRSQAQEVVDLLQDPDRCRILLVTLPEELPVSETVEAAYQLEDRAGIHLGPVVVNAFEGVPPALTVDVDEAARDASMTLEPAVREALESARRFRLHRCELAEEQAARLAQELPLPQLRLPRLDAPAIGPDELRTLADALRQQVDALPSRAGAA